MKKNKNNKQRVSLAKIFFLMSIFILLSFFIFNYFNNPKKTEVDSVKSSSLSQEPVLDEIVLKENMIIADLKNMKISLIENGKVKESFGIVSKGKPGSYYETPAGDYKIESKFTNKFSNLGEVYMPYAMQFYGNFFIHGIPYYPDGTRVSTSYSGGCIRLQDADAKKIFEFSKIGTRTMILTNSAEENNFDPGVEKSKNMLIVLTALENVNQEKYVIYNGKEVKIQSLNAYAVNGDKEAQNIIKNQIGKYNFEIKMQSS